MMYMAYGSEGQLEALSKQRFSNTCWNQRQDRHVQVKGMLLMRAAVGMVCHDLKCHPKMGCVAD